MFSLQKSTVSAFGAALILCPLVGSSEPGQKPAAATTHSASDLPVPKSPPQKSLRVPIYSPDGHHQMDLEIGVPNTLDDGNLKLERLRFHTLKPDGTTTALDVQMPSALFDKRTMTLSSQAPTRLLGSGFELVSEKISFRMKDQSLILEGATQRLQLAVPEAEPRKKLNEPLVEPQKPSLPSPTIPAQR